MALRAFIFIEVAADHTRSALKTIRRMDGIKAVHCITGNHDLLVHIEGETLEKVNDVLQEIRSVQGVMKTNTSVDLNS